MKMETKKVLSMVGVSAVALATTLGLAFAPQIELPVLTRASNNSYTCSSIHFGMHDDDYTAMTYSSSNIASDLSTQCVVGGGLSIVRCSFTNVYHGGTYTNDNTDYSSYAWKLGGSKKKPIMEICLNEDIVGLTLYCLAFGTDPTTIKVNDILYTLTKSCPDTKKADASVQTYEKVSFTIEPCCVITISTENASKVVNGKSVSACRFFLADIAFRVAN